ncbi:MAG: ComEA family DNA-binding protein [Candidatus Cryptobacteroides sp.]
MTRNNQDEGKKHSPSASFVTGAIALAFLITGYQTALFIHRAAALKIVSSVPDTVYITSGVTPDSAFSGVEVRSASSHDVRNPLPDNGRSRSSVRSAFMPRTCESFRFDPNTVSVEDLRRLGFTDAQAASIDNYRSKGGRFRRKSDFAASYVVHDSVFQRLEPYIDIPKIDLNAADSAMFDSLPGIGGYFASKMVEYRKRLGGYSCPEQLMEIYHFDKERYDALSDLVEVRTPPKPFRLWTLPVDSLRIHPHIRDNRTAKAIVLYRENNPASALTVEGLAEAGIIDRETALKLSRCIIR